MRVHLPGARSHKCRYLLIAADLIWVRVFPKSVWVLNGNLRKYGNRQLLCSEIWSNLHNKVRIAWTRLSCETPVAVVSQCVGQWAVETDYSRYSTDFPLFVCKLFTETVYGILSLGHLEKWLQNNPGNKKKDVCCDSELETLTGFYGHWRL